MLKQAVCWAFVVFSINWLANDVFNSGARTRIDVTTGNLILAATQSQPSVNSAERDEAIEFSGVCRKRATSISARRLGARRRSHCGG